MQWDSRAADLTGRAPGVAPGARHEPSLELRMIFILPQPFSGGNWPPPAERVRLPQTRAIHGSPAGRFAIPPKGEVGRGL
jgi:hypothetical protein